MPVSYFVAEQLGENQALTPEGFLICKNVPIARTGEMYYRADEIPVEPGPDGIVRVQRDADEVLAPEALASFEGKPVTNDHPSEVVTPDNWKQYAVGSVQNVRAGDGPLSLCIVADLLITDADAIQDVRDGKREVSCGYDALYVQIAPGRAVQRQIRGNHVALVERGRCGPVCSIGDTTPMKSSLTQKLLALLGSHTADEEGAGVHIHLGGEKEESKDDDKFKAYDERIGGLEKSMSALADAFTKMSAAKDAEEEPGDPDKAKAKDADEKEEKEEKAKAEDSLKRVLEVAAILAPELTLSVPTFDAKSKDGFRDELCRCKRQTLAAAHKTEDGKKAVEVFTGAAPSFDTLPRETVDAAFLGASELLKQQNNARGVRSAITSRDFGKAPRSVEAINEANRQYWAQRGVK